jgi:hypothetical protein
MGALDEESVAVTGALHLHNQEQQQLGTALEAADQVFSVLEKISGEKIVEQYEEFDKSMVQETTHLKYRKWQQSPLEEYKQTSSSDEEESLDMEGEENFGIFRADTRGQIISDPRSIFGPHEEAADGQEISIDEILREKVEFLEAALKAKVMEMESLKRASREKETDLLDKIECLELANEQLLQGGADAGGTDQLQMELMRLQNQNSMLAQRGHELQLQISTTDMLQNEVKHLQELNEQLIDERVQAQKINNLRSTASVLPDPAELPEPAENSLLEERIDFLETELAEAMEVNNMYKAQLQFSFSKEENVQATALRSFGENVTDIITELLDLRKRTKTQEAELQDLQNRFILMSIQLAETQASREELLMKIKKLQNLQLINH